MRIEKPNCPTCGKPADAILETVYCLSGIMQVESEPADPGLFDYDGNGTEVIWDSQTAVESPDGVTLECPAGHRWESPADEMEAP